MWTENAQGKNCQAQKKKKIEKEQTQDPRVDIRSYQGTQEALLLGLKLNIRFAKSAQASHEPAYVEV